MLARSPALLAAAGVCYLAALLALDHVADLHQQLVLGGVTFLALALACVPQPPERRAQAVVVVAVATCFEVLGSIVWGVYHYRLGNLPLFVPPAHGIVYLTGCAIGRTRAARRRPRALVGLALAGAVAWALVGLTALQRTDAIGAFGVLVFSVFLLRSGRGAVLAGVFFVVAGLELYGTALGEWRWEAVVPGLGLPDGNPPSGAVSGYVLFDLVAFAAAPTVLGIARAVAARSPLARRAALAGRAT